ncbi:MAG: right-handed parallel beta-helix repeat-containing protein [Bacteroidota bacterium]
MLRETHRLYVMLLIIILMLFPSAVLSAQIGINTDNSPPDASAILDLKSTTQGFLTPRMTQAERDAIIDPATALLIYQTDETHGFYYNQGTPAAPDWIRIGNEDDAPICDFRIPIDSVLFQSTFKGQMTEYLITEPGSYYLTGVIQGIPDGTSGVTIASDNVTLDLNGYAIIGAQPNSNDDATLLASPPGNGSGIRIDSIRKNISVRNGIIERWGENGIEADQTVNSIFRDLTIYNSGEEGIIVGNQNLLQRINAELNIGPSIVGKVGNNMIHCNATNGGATGILADSLTNIVNCGTFNNLGVGIRVNFGGMALGCVSTDNRLGGISLGPFSYATKSAAYDNGEDGFRIDNNGHVSNCNASLNEGDGFDLIGATGSITHCVAHENDSVGIHLSNLLRCDMLVSHNGVTDNDTDGFLIRGGGAFLINNWTSGNLNTPITGLGFGDGYDISPFTKYGPMIDVRQVGDISTVPNADSPIANFIY